MIRVAKSIIICHCFGVCYCCGFRIRAPNLTLEKNTSFLYIEPSEGVTLMRNVDKYWKDSQFVLCSYFVHIPSLYHISCQTFIRKSFRNQEKLCVLLIFWKLLGSVPSLWRYTKEREREREEEEGQIKTVKIAFKRPTFPEFWGYGKRELRD